MNDATTKSESVSLCFVCTLACLPVFHIVCFIYGECRRTEWERKRVRSSFNTSSLRLFIVVVVAVVNSRCVFEAAIRFIVVAAVSFLNSRSFRYFNHHFVWIGLYSVKMLYCSCFCCYCCLI